MSRSGQNGGGKGGRNYRLNWTDLPHAEAEFGPWAIRLKNPGTAFPYTVCYMGEPVHQAHGNFHGYRRFKTAENAKRWVEKFVREKP